MQEKPNTITYTHEQGLRVPDEPVIPFIEGDGSGVDIWAAARPVLDAAVARAYGQSRAISWLEVLAGEKARRYIKVASSMMNRPIKTSAATPCRVLNARSTKPLPGSRRFKSMITKSTRTKIAPA